jgi:hypothetical protein
MPQQKIEGRLHHRDDQVDLAALVFAAEVITQEVLVVGAAELRDVERLAVELDLLVELGAENLLDVAVDDRQARQVLVLVEHQEHLRSSLHRSGQRARGECDEQQAAELWAENVAAMYHSVHPVRLPGEGRNDSAIARGPTSDLS